MTVSEEEFEECLKHVRGRCVVGTGATIEAYVQQLRAERDDFKKQLQGALAMYDERLAKYDALKRRVESSPIITYSQTVITEGMTRTVVSEQKCYAVPVEAEGENGEG